MYMYKGIYNFLQVMSCTKIYQTAQHIFIIFWHLLAAWKTKFLRPFWSERSKDLHAHKDASNIGLKENNYRTLRQLIDSNLHLVFKRFIFKYIFLHNNKTKKKTKKRTAQFRIFDRIPGWVIGNPHCGNQYNVNMCQ